jgi:hypothetical protein
VGRLATLSAFWGKWWIQFLCKSGDLYGVNADSHAK